MHQAQSATETPSTRRRRIRPPLDPDALWYDMSECASVMGESPRTTKRRLQKRNAAFRVGGRWYVSRGSLLSALGARGLELAAELEARKAAPIGQESDETV